MDRVILHVDLNAFFASVEIVFNPHLSNVPLIVGGDPKKRHGIVLAKNEIAKKAGIKTGDTIWQAKQKINGLVVVPPRRKECAEFSKAARKIYESYTDCVEDFGIDECWLDVTGSIKLFGSGKQIADEIRKRLKDELKLTASVGVSYNKIFAKLGSDYKKPDATTAITRENFKSILWKLPAREMFMIGRKTAEKLARCGILTIGDVAQSGKDFLKSMFGKHGETLYKYANGLDDEPVKKSYYFDLPKSVGNSTTTKRDLVCYQDARLVFIALAENVAVRLRNQRLRGSVVSIGVRSSETLKWESFQHKLLQATDLASDIGAAAVKIFNERVSLPFSFRTLALSVSGIVQVECESRQECFLFDEEDVKHDNIAKIESALDELNSKFGKGTVRVGVFGLDEDLMGDVKLGSLIDDKGNIDLDE